MSALLTLKRRNYDRLLESI
uniref:Uncharacterized protein n=1 Tax=Rhizophora mucronata TaxID=61149 RepID=A0A2P2PRZ3_RHIMU